MRNNRAFTLIEALIVVAILLLLASLIVPVVQGSKAKSAYQTSYVNLSEVAKAMEKHYLERGKYPVFQSWEEVAAEESPLREYLNDIPAKDSLGRPYKVEESSEKTFRFRGFGLEGKLHEEYGDYMALPGPKMKKADEK